MGRTKLMSGSLLNFAVDPVVIHNGEALSKYVSLIIHDMDQRISHRA